MKRLILTGALVLQLQCAAAPEVSPAQGCDFAIVVLNEVRSEDARIQKEMQSASLARKVVLTVQQQSAANLKTGTMSWMTRNCQKSSSSSSPVARSSSSSSSVRVSSSEVSSSSRSK